MAVAMHPTPHHHHHLHNHLREFQFQYLQRDQLGPTALINNNNYNTGYCPSTSSSASSFPSFSGSSSSPSCFRSWNRAVRAEAFWQSLSKPTSIEMEAIEGMEEFEEALREAKELSRPIVVDWMAAWCRKCIYLKPKLEKLAAEYQDKVKFYYIDVNKVPQALVKLANISKMPTIQLWKDDKMKEEVIGGHKAWLVVDEVREMIDKHLRN